MNASKRKTIIGAVTVFLVGLGTIAYLLADRYLIQHVEIDQAIVTATASETLSDEALVVASNNPVGAPSASATSAETGTVSYDDWNYSSDGLSISIREVTSGSGADTITYFIADVVLTDASQLDSAFANNQFGRNIIDYTSAIAADNNAIFAVNGDYYGFRTDGIIIRNGVIYRDVPARIGLAFYRDGTMKIYDETQTSAEALLADGVWNTLSFGPGLIVDGVVAANLDSVEIDGNFGNHPISGNQPRTGVGIISPNHYVFVVVDGRSTGYSRGMSLTEFAAVFADLGCTQAYNIDGGGSSTLYFMGRVVNNPLGRNKERGTSDILYIG